MIDRVHHAWRRARLLPGMRGIRAVVSLTFDDGLSDQLRVRGALGELGMPATFFVNTGFVGTEPEFMSWSQLEGLRRDGHEIGGHTLEHPMLTELPSSEARRQVTEDRRRLLARGFAARSFAYPFGDVDARTRDILAASGYRSARRAWGLCETPGDGRPLAESVAPSDPFEVLTPASFTSETTLEQIQATVERAEEVRGWAPLVFHHVCDGCDLYATHHGLLEEFLTWLSERAARGTIVRTVEDVVAGRLRTATSANGR